MLSPILILLNVVIYPFAAWRVFLIVKEFRYQREMSKHCLGLFDKIKKDEGDLLKLFGFFQGPDAEHHIFLDYAEQSKDLRRVQVWTKAIQHWEYSVMAQKKLPWNHMEGHIVVTIDPPRPEHLPHLRNAAAAIKAATEELRLLQSSGRPKPVKPEYWLPPEPDREPQAEPVEQDAEALVAAAS